MSGLEETKTEYTVIVNKYILKKVLKLLKVYQIPTVFNSVKSHFGVRIL